MKKIFSQISTKWSKQKKKKIKKKKKSKQKEMRDLVQSHHLYDFDFLFDYSSYDWKESSSFSDLYPRKVSFS